MEGGYHENVGNAETVILDPGESAPASAPEGGVVELREGARVELAAGE